MTRHVFTLLLIAALALGAAACREEGRAEQAGRKVDEAVDKLFHGDEGPLEQAGREIDEAAEETKAAVDEARDKVADAIEGED